MQCHCQMVESHTEVFIFLVCLQKSNTSQKRNSGGISIPINYLGYLVTLY